MNLHISTAESQLAGSISHISDCPVCMKKAQQRIGYNGSHCSGCKSYYGLGELNQTFKLRRKYLGLTRKQYASALGLMASAVKNYESQWPSKSAWFKSGHLVLAVES